MSTWQSKQTTEGQYKGQLEKGEPNGHGQLVFHPTQTPQLGEHYDIPHKYEGEFKKGKPHGLGKLTFKNGDVYCGAIRSSAPKGRGELRFGENWKNKGNSLEDNEGMEIFPEKGDALRGDFGPSQIKKGTLSDGNGNTIDVKG
jgi:hypothetical protein